MLNLLAELCLIAWNNLVSFCLFSLLLSRSSDTFCLLSALRKEATGVRDFIAVNFDPMRILSTSTVDLHCRLIAF